MTSRDFCYWLQGYFEIKEGENTVPSNRQLTHEQVCMIKSHLAMVFAHEIDPSHGDKKHQDILSQLHQGTLDPSNIKVNC